MIIKEVCFVTPSSPAVIMVSHNKGEDVELLAREQAAAFTDTVYFEVDVIIDGTKEEDDWPDVQWENWYGKVITSNVFACYDVPGILVDRVKFTEPELKWFLNTHDSAILFIHEEGV